MPRMAGLVLVCLLRPKIPLVGAPALWSSLLNQRARREHRLLDGMFVRHRAFTGSDLARQKETRPVSTALDFM